MFRTGSERLALAVLGTPLRRRAMAGVALLALSSLRPLSGRDGEEPAPQARLPEDALPPLLPPAHPRPIGLAPVRRVFSSRDRRTFGWIMLAVSIAIAALGTIGESQLVLLLGAVGAVACVSVMTPEVVIALFLLAGAIKAAPWMPALPVDLTLLSWLAMVVAMVIAVLQPGGIPRVPRTAMLGLGLIALVLASVWWSRDTSEGLTKAMTFEVLTMSGFAAPLLLVRTRAAMSRLMLALVGSGLLIALTTVATDNPSEPLIAAGGNEITAGLYPAIGLIAAVGYFAFMRRGRWRLIGLLPVAVLLPAVVAAGSRGVLIAGAVALAFVIARHIACSRRPLLTGVLVAVSLLVAVQVASSLAGGAAAKYESSLLSTDSRQVLGDREDLYQRAVTLALDHPFSGVGAGGYAASSLVYERGLYPHNVILEFASEQGSTAVLILLLLIAAAWWARRRAPGGLRSPEAVVTGGLILLGLVEAFASFDINGNRVLWFALGLAFAVAQLRPGRASLPAPRR